MKEKLNFKELAAISSMLFGMFFGAGNLIFPVHLGQLAGSNTWQAVLGFIVTGVGLPLLGVAALGISRSSGLQELSSKVSRGYGMFFTCALYLTIGPCFAIPRCATVSFTVGIVPMFHGGSEKMLLLLFSVLFFAVVLAFSLRPTGILTWIGKLLNPIFLVFLGVLTLTALFNPLASVAEIAPDAAYESGAFFNGFLEGYNTMDALASLAFGVVVVNVVRDLGIEKEDAVAMQTVRAGFFSCLLMALIYVAVTVMGTQSRGLFATSENGGIALSEIADHYFGTFGVILLAVTVTFACLKTAIGLITSCAETFTKMFPKSPGYRFWAVLFSVVSCLFANVGLTAIIDYAIPVLMFLYPLAITLILLALFGKFFDHDRRVYVSVTVLTLVAAVGDLCRTLPGGLTETLHLDVITRAAEAVLPFFNLGLGWICPAAIGLAIGLILHVKSKAKQ